MPKNAQVRLITTAVLALVAWASCTLGQGQDEVSILGTVTKTGTPPVQVLVAARVIVTPTRKNDEPKPRFVPKATTEGMEKSRMIAAPRITVVDGQPATIRKCDKTGEGIIIELTPTVTGDKIRLKGQAWVSKAAGKLTDTNDGDRVWISWHQGSHVDFALTLTSSEDFVAITSLPYEKKGRPAETLEIWLSARLVTPQGQPIQ